jgi:hypothetical protein
LFPKKNPGSFLVKTSFVALNSYFSHNKK